MITTFYSYKGGVGRTQLTANLASYLFHHRKKKVLLIDWDLDAPGLHFYFDIKDLKNKGVIELFSSYLQTIQNENDITEDQLPHFDEDYRTTICNTEDKSACIDLITAGEYNDTYNRRMNSFNWHDFYEQYDGKLYIEFLKDKLNGLGYDFIFIDSRTGVSDYSGICNIQLPDINVIVVSPTMQNLDGAIKVADTISSSSYVLKGMRKAVIMPLLSRIDLSIEHKTGEWFELFHSTFMKYINDFGAIVAVSDDTYLKDTLLDYKRDISFDEQLLFSKVEKTIKNKSLAKQYQNISNYLERVKLTLSNTEEQTDLIVNIKLSGTEHKGLVDEITRVIVNNAATKMRNITTDDSNLFTISTHLFIENLDKLSDLVKELKNVKGIDTVQHTIRKN